MEKRELGKTGIFVSPLGLGTVKFGRNEQVKYPNGFQLPTESEIAALLSFAHEMGINTLDTAPAYGTSEERLGRLLTNRKDWIIIGKAGENFIDGQSQHNFTADHFEKSFEQSLKNLKTDYLDVLLVHSNGNDVEILSDVTLIEKLHDFKKRGLVKAIGASTKTIEGGLLALEKLDVAMITHTQDHPEEKPVLDSALTNKKGIILKKSLNSGHNTNIQDAFDFAFSHPAVSCVIAGTVNPAHLGENVMATMAALKKYL